MFVDQNEKPKREDVNFVVSKNEDKISRNVYAEVLYEDTIGHLIGEPNRFYTNVT